VKDYFRITIPWTADLSRDPDYSRGGHIYDVTGTLVQPGVVNAGVYYMLFEPFNFDRREISGVSLHRVLDISGGAKRRDPEHGRRFYRPQHILSAVPVVVALSQAGLSRRFR